MVWGVGGECGGDSWAIGSLSMAPCGFEDKGFYGDSGNSAVFITGQFYLKERSLGQLAKIAAQTIVVGAERSRGFVDGLDVVMARFAHLGEQELDDLRRF